MTRTLFGDEPEPPAPPAVDPKKAIPPRPDEKLIFDNVRTFFTRYCPPEYAFASRHGIDRGWSYDYDRVNREVNPERLSRRFNVGFRFPFGPCAGPWALEDSRLHWCLVEVVYDRAVSNPEFWLGKRHEVGPCAYDTDGDGNCIEHPDGCPKWNFGPDLYDAERRGEREAIFARAESIASSSALDGEHPGLRGWKMIDGHGSNAWSRCVPGRTSRVGVQCRIWWAGRNGWRWQVGRGSRTATPTKFGHMPTYRNLAAGVTLSRGAALEAAEPAIAEWLGKEDNLHAFLAEKAKAAALSRKGKKK